MTRGRQQLDPRRGGCDARHPTQQPPWAENGIVLGNSIKAAAAELKLLPPVPGTSGNHRCSNIPTSLTALLKIQQFTQSLVVLLQQAEASTLLQISGCRHPLPLRRTRPERACQQGISINKTGALAESHQQQTRHQQEPGSQPPENLPAICSRPKRRRHPVRRQRQRERIQEYPPPAEASSNPPGPDRIR
ncbi:MAG: Uncharacterised protein [Synechococcus sp. CC9902]|nr:MAG: Uncharacterised protein [Synechococcus sp. CC9902]